MDMMKLIKTITIIGIFGLLTACGGGGGGVTITNTPNGPSVGGTINTNALTSTFTEAWVDLKPNEKKELVEMYELFKEVEYLQTRYNITSNDLKNLSGTIEINKKQYNAAQAWQIIIGFKNRYYDGNKDLWKNISSKGGFDDGSSDYIDLNNKITEDETKLITFNDKAVEYYRKLGEEKEKRVENDISDDIVKWKLEYTEWVNSGTTSSSVLCTTTHETRDKFFRKYINDVAQNEKIGNVKETRSSESCVENRKISYTDSSSFSSTDETGSASVTATETVSTRTVESTDSDGNTITTTYTTYKDTYTAVKTTTTVTTTTRTHTWTDGSTTTETLDPVTTTSTENVVTHDTREEVTDVTSTANIVSYADRQSTSSTESTGDSTTTTTSTTEDRVSTDVDGNTVTKTFIIYTDTVTTPVTTTTITTTTRTYTWSDGSTTTEVIGTTSSDSVTNTVSTNEREELSNTVITANIVSYSDSESTSSSESVGDATTTTETTSTRQTTETDDSGNTVVKTYTTYTDITTTPVTTTTTVVTTRTYTWSDGSTTTEVIDTTATDSVANTVTTATREVLTNTTTTANKVSYSDSSTTSTTTTVSEPVLTNTTTNTDTREDGVYTFYYRTWTTTTTVVNTTTTVRTWTWSDGTTTTETLDPVVETTETTSDEVITEVVAPEETTNGGDAPTDNSGSNTVVQDDAPTLDFDPDTYVASSYYDSNAMGTPTEVSSHNPADHSTEEFDNNANMEVNANYAYARGWTGKGSVALIIDTGIDTDHSEFDGKIKYTWDLGFDTPVEDENGHGTHVAGIVAASKDGVGTHGVAYDAELAVAKVGERTGISLSGARSALEWAKQYDDIVVANISANTNYSSSYRDAITDHGNGIFTNNHTIYGGTNYYNLTDPQDWADVLPNELVLVVSAGNTTLGYVQNPATYASAVDSNGKLVLDGRMLVAGNWNTSSNTISGAKSGHVCKDYSNDTCNDTYRTSDFYILAPGMSVNSTYNDGSYKTMSGTSMAAPVVTGAVSIVHQLWPYMQGENIAQVLLQTADKTISGYNVNTHGQGLLDLDKATRPIGNLGISLTGRTGTTTPLSGTISVDGIESAVVSSVSAIDDFDRDFSVDLSSMVNNNTTSIEQLKHKRGQSWGIKYANIDTQEYNNFTIGTDNEDVYALGYTHNFDKYLDLTITYSNSNESPWINMSGVWGEVTGSNTLDINATWSNDDAFWAQLGIMSTKTNISNGLVTDVSDVTSAYVVAGTTYNNFDIYGGIKPKVINGSVNLNVPTSVDRNGIMHYNPSTRRLNSSITPFIGVDRKFYLRENNDDVSLNTGVIADAKGNHSIGFAFEYKF